MKDEKRSDEIRHAFLYLSGNNRAFYEKAVSGVNTRCHNTLADNLAEQSSKHPEIFMGILVHSCCMLKLFLRTVLTLF